MPLHCTGEPFRCAPAVNRESTPYNINGDKNKQWIFLNACLSLSEATKTKKYVPHPPYSQLSHDAPAATLHNSIASARGSWQHHLLVCHRNLDNLKRQQWLRHDTSEKISSTNCNTISHKFLPNPSFARSANHPLACAPVGTCACATATARATGITNSTGSIERRPTHGQNRAR